MMMTTFVRAMRVFHPEEEKVSFIFARGVCFEPIEFCSGQKRDLDTVE